MPEQEQDSLITVVEDDLITAETTNKNNRYLESTMINYAGELRQYLQTQNTALRNDLENEINTAKNELQGNINTLNTKVNNINFMPNYSTAQNNKAADTWHSATVSGWLHLQTGAIDDRKDPYLQIKYNGVTRTFRSSGSTTATEHFYYCIVAPCPAGATYYMYAGNSGATLSFIPNIGG